MFPSTTNHLKISSLGSFKVPLFLSAMPVNVLSHFSRVWLSATPWTVARQAPLSMGLLQARTLEWGAMPFSRGSFQPRDWTRVSCEEGRFLTADKSEHSSEKLGKTFMYIKYQIVCKKHIYQAVALTNNFKYLLNNNSEALCYLMWLLFCFVLMGWRSGNLFWVCLVLCVLQPSYMLESG